MSLVQHEVANFFVDWDLSISKIFRDEMYGFLFFNHENITEPHLFHFFIQNARSPMYIGYLPPFIDNTHDSAQSALYVSEDAGLEQITNAFTQDPGLPEEAAIQYFVRSGFVFPPKPRWSIWFSTYWEIAICGFLSNCAADNFRAVHANLPFLNNEDVISKYKTNPASSATSYLSHHLRLNLL